MYKYIECTQQEIKNYIGPKSSTHNRYRNIQHLHRAVPRSQRATLAAKQLVPFLKQLRNMSEINSDKTLSEC